MEILDDGFLRAYRAFIMQFNDLRDCAWRVGEGWNRLTNEQLAWLRNNPAAAYVECPIPGCAYTRRIFRNDVCPSPTRIAAHLANQREQTVWATNVLTEMTRTLLMLVDLDNKAGGADADAAAKLVLDRYLAGAGLVEASTGGRGRHIYFKCAVGSASAQEVWQVMEDLAHVVREDDTLRATGVTLDAVFYGLPTVWRRDAAGLWDVVRRGTPFRLPYAEGFDLRPFTGLPSLDLVYLTQMSRESASFSPDSRNNEEDISVTTGGERGFEAQSAFGEMAGDACEHPDARLRRVKCWSEVVRLTNGQGTVDDCLDRYHRHYAYTGDGEADVRRRRRDFERLFRVLGPQFRPALPGGNPHARPFRSGQYLELVTQIVPPSEFEWGRRELLNHRRLADFVGIKVQDAFFAKADDRYMARASRNATLTNFGALRRKGLVDWTCTTHQYTRLLEIAMQYKFLHEYEAAVSPWDDGAELRGGRWTGLPRMIGPGPRLELEHGEFVALYEAWTARRRARAQLLREPSDN